MSDRSDFNDLATVAGAEAVAEVIERAMTAQYSAVAVAAPVVDLWPDPILPGTKQTPEITAGILPGIFGEFAAAVAESTQTPPALSAMFTLSVLATVLQGRFEVSPYGDDYREPLSIWTCSCYPVGGRKTAVFNACIKPVQRWEKLAADRSRSEIARRRASREVALKKIEMLKHAAAKAGDAEERERLRQEIQLELENMPAEMKAPRCFTSNATPERTEGLLSEQNGRIGILSDESDTFLNLSGGLRGGMASLDVVLKGHAGSSIRVDRQGREAHLDRPALSMGLIVQPETFAELAAGRRLRNTGILARYLYAMPKSNIGQRDVRRRASIPQDIEDGYYYAVIDLLQDYEDGTASPVVLEFSSEAREPLMDFAEEIEREQGEGGKYEEISDWTSKLPGAVVRLAALFQLAQEGLGARTVQVDQVQRALSLCRLLIPHALAAFAMLGADDTDIDALAVLRWIKEGEKKEFTRRDVQQAMRRRFTKLERLIDALAVLRDLYIISGEKKTNTGGRPSSYFLVNPKLYAKGETV